MSISNVRLKKYRSRSNDKLVFGRQNLIEEPVFNRNLKEITTQVTTRNYYEVNLPEIVEGTKRVDFGATDI